MRGLNARAGAQQDLPARAPPSLQGGAVVNQAFAGTAARPLEAGRRDRQGDRRAERPRAGARRTDRQLQHLLRRLRRAVDRPRRLVAELPELAARASTAGFAALDASFGPTRTFAHDIIPGVKPTPVDGRRDAAVDRAGRRPRWRRTSSAAWPKGLVKPVRRWPSSRPNRCPFYTADRPVQQMPHQT